MFRFDSYPTSCTQTIPITPESLLKKNMSNVYDRQKKEHTSGKSQYRPSTSNRIIFAGNDALCIVDQISTLSIANTPSILLSTPGVVFQHNGSGHGHQRSGHHNSGHGNSGHGNSGHGRQRSGHHNSEHCQISGYHNSEHGQMSGHVNSGYGHQGSMYTSSYHPSIPIELQLRGVLPMESKSKSKSNSQLFNHGQKQISKCNAPGCKKQHTNHYCKICGNGNSNHQDIDCYLYKH